MENQRGLVIALWIVVLFGAFFLARGLTGKAIMETTSDTCSLNIDCDSGKICCVFQDGRGRCYEPEICSAINSQEVEKPKTEREYLQDIGLGLLILLTVLIAFYGIEKRSMRKEVKVSGKKSRKKKKR